MSGTPSRTATARSRGRVERKLETKLRSEEHESHKRQPSGGRGAVGTRSPMTSGPSVVYAAELERRSRALPWEICSFADESVREVRFGRAVEVDQAAGCARGPAGTKPSCNAKRRKRLVRSRERTTSEQKSADAILSLCAGG